MIYPWLQDHWAFFIKRLEQDRLAHALMVEGPAGSGKNDLALHMVAKLLCTEDEAMACGHCRSCKILVGGAHPDCFKLSPEEDSDVIKVDQVRALTASLNLTSSIGQRKVALVTPAESMNIASSNALLKSLEEPNGDAVLILVCSEPARLPITIRSRCQSMVVNQPDTVLVSNWLQQTSGQAQNEVEEALAAAGGSPLRASGYLESPETAAYDQVQQGLATLLARPGAVSMVSTSLADLQADDLWRWISMSMGEAVKSVMTGSAARWLPDHSTFDVKSLLKLQNLANYNRRLSRSPVRGDLLLQDWLIRWVEQNI